MIESIGDHRENRPKSKTCVQHQRLQLKINSKVYQVLAGSYIDAFGLLSRLKIIISAVKAIGFSIEGSYLDSAPAFDTKAARKICFHNCRIPNVKKNS